MADVLHSDLTDPELHEPIGISTANAGEVYVADGAGSGAWTAAAAATDVLTLDIADGSAEADYYLVAPYDGDISSIRSVIDGAVATADIIITSSIGGVAVTNGAITIATAASGAGDIDSCAPSALNSVTAGQAIKFNVTGGGAGGSPRIHLTIIIERT